MKIKLLILLLIASIGASAQYVNVGANGVQRQIISGDSTFRWNLGAAGFLYGKSLSWYRSNFSPNLTFSNGLTRTGNDVKLGGVLTDFTTIGDIGVLSGSNGLLEVFDKTLTGNFIANHTTFDGRFGSFTNFTTSTSSAVTIKSREITGSYATVETVSDGDDLARVNINVLSGIGNTGLQIKSSTGAILRDEIFKKGIRTALDYTKNFTAADSLYYVNKRYADSLANAAKLNADSRQSSAFTPYNKGFWSNLSDFTVVGTTPTISSTNSVSYTGGANYTQYLKVNGLTTADQNIDFEVTFQVGALGNGMAVGKKGIQFVGSSPAVNISYNTSTNVLTIGVAAGVVKTSASNFVTAVNDVLRVKYIQRGMIVSGEVFNVTQGIRFSITEKSFFTQGVNTADFVVYSLGGNNSIQKIEIVSFTNTHPAFAILGDSKSILPNFTGSWSTYTKSLGNSSNFASSGALIADMISQLPYFLTYIHADDVFLNIGRNDLAVGTPLDTIKAQYAYLTNALTSAGKRVIHIKPIPEITIADQSAISDIIDDNGYADVIDVTPYWSNALHLSPDNVHPNEAGARLLGNRVVASGFISPTGTYQDIPNQNALILGDITGRAESASTSVTATTANTLTTPRLINNVSFNGSADIVTPTIYDVNFRRITNPGGATYTGSSSPTGAIEIVLPVGVINSFMTITVNVFNYTSAGSFSMKISGYVSAAWNNCTAYVMGQPAADRKFTVRFGYNSAGKAVIYVGELASTWSAPQVYVTDATFGFGGYTSSLLSGWAINFQSTAFEGVMTTVTDTQAAALSTNTPNAIVRRDASGNFSASTITAALTGNASTATSAATLTTTRTIWGQNFNGSANVTGAMTGVTTIVASSTITGSNLSGTNTGDNATNTTSNTYADAKVQNSLTASTTVAPSATAVNTALALKADLNNAALTGNPTAPTQAAIDNSTKLATTAYVTSAVTATNAISIKSQRSMSTSQTLSSSTDYTALVNVTTGSDVIITLPNAPLGQIFIVKKINSSGIGNVVVTVSNSIDNGGTTKTLVTDNVGNVFQSAGSGQYYIIGSF